MLSFVAALLAVLALACSAEHAEKGFTPPPEPAKPAAVAPPAKKIGPTDFGSCTVKASGAFTVEETITGDKKAASSKYWQSEDERTATPLPALTVNCIGKDVRLSFVSAPDTEVPFGIKTYEIAGKKSDLVLLGRAGDQLSDFKGQVVIDAFDNKRVVGSFELDAKQGMGKKRVALEGRFDFACPGMAGCAR